LWTGDNITEDTGTEGARDFVEEVLRPERQTINEDLDYVFDELEGRVTSSENEGTLSPNADLAIDENVNIGNHSPESEVVREMKRFTNPDSPKGPKRLRPATTRWVAKEGLEENPDWENILNEDSLEEVDERGITPEEKYEEEVDDVSLTLEMYHNFTLFHDDINDQDEVRRHVPTGWASERDKAEERGLEEEEAERHGKNIAMHEGNDLREFAYQVINDSDFKPEKILEMQRSVISVGDRIIQGQVRDLTMEHIDLERLFDGEDGEFTDLLMGDVDSAEDLYLDMIDKKTVDLYVAAADIGAIAADMSEDQRDHIRRYARNMGIPFQIRDDINEIRSVSGYGPEPGLDEREDNADRGLGKEATDISNGKTTLPVLTAYSNLEEEIREIEEDIQNLGGDDELGQLVQAKRGLEYDKALIEGFYGNEELDNNQVRKVADAIYRHESASDIYSEKINEAIEHLEEADIPGDTENLELLAEYMKDRDY
jgi:geranylgeranyl diphosphate synthase type I